MPILRRVKAVVESIHSYNFCIIGVVIKISESYTRFKAGQFTHLTVEVYDSAGGYWSESRVLSIALKPIAPKIRIVYSIEGKYMKNIFDTLSVGSTFWLKLPYGDFTIEKDLTPERTIILITGGTGIALYIPYLLGESKANLEWQVILNYGIRDPSLLIFEDELNHAMPIMSGFSMHLYSEVSTVDERIRIGPLDLETIKNKGNVIRSPVFFISGPPR